MSEINIGDKVRIQGEGPILDVVAIHQKAGDGRRYAACAYKGDIPTWKITSALTIVKTVTVDLMADFKAIGTINLVDGVPDFNSIKSD